MTIEIKVPPLGESIVEATVGSILQPSGSQVRVDAELLELETDKVNQILYAPASGKVQYSVKVGDLVKVGQTIGFIEPSTSSTEPSPPSPSKQEAPTAPVTKKETTVQKTEEKKQRSTPASKDASQPTFATPSTNNVRKMPDEFLVEIQRPNIPSSASHADSSSVSTGSKDEGRTTRKKMSKLRRIISQKLVEVKNQTAMLTTFNEVDMSAIMAVREKEQENFQKRHSIKLGFMSFFVKACVAALEEYPAINARIEGDEIVYCNFFDIGIAVGTEKGLMVPVLRNADKMGYAEIEKALKTFADKARSGTISVDDLQGGTFTITNGGVYGSLLSTPILNPPQSGILGMHNIVKRPIAIGEDIVIRPMMYLALSYDHRVVDGKESIGFLVHIKKNLEEPARLLLDL